MNARRIFVLVLAVAILVICGWIFFTAPTYSPQAPMGPPTHSSTR